MPCSSESVSRALPCAVAYNGTSSSSLTGDCDYVPRMHGVNKQRALAFADRQVRSLVQTLRKGLQLLVRHAHQHIAPVILTRKGPHRRAQDVVLSPGLASSETAPPQGLRQPEHTAAVHLEQLRQLASVTGCFDLATVCRIRQGRDPRL